MLFTISRLPGFAASWLPWAVQYFFLIGIGTTAALTAAGAVFMRSNTPIRQLLPVATAVTAGSALALPVSLLLALYSPNRYWTPATAFAPQSGTPEGVIIISVYIVLALAFCLSTTLKRQWPHRVLGGLLGLSAGVALLYSGAQIMTLYNAPLWNTIFLPLLLAVTGWAGAVGAMLLIGPGLRFLHQPMPVELLGRQAAWAVTLVILVLVAWGLLSGVGLDRSYDTAHSLYQGSTVWRMAFYIVIAAIVASSLVLMRPTLLRRCGARLPVALCLLATAWVFRWMLFSGGLGVLIMQAS